MNLDWVMLTTFLAGAVYGAGVLAMIDRVFFHKRELDNYRKEGSK
jgi:hypothetical protein